MNGNFHEFFIKAVDGEFDCVTGAESNGHAYCRDPAGSEINVDVVALWGPPSLLSSLE
jgi:hypothetical protein